MNNVSFLEHLAQPRSKVLTLLSHFSPKPQGSVSSRVALYKPRSSRLFFPRISSLLNSLRRRNAISSLLITWNLSKSTALYENQVQKIGIFIIFFLILFFIVIFIFVFFMCLTFMFFIFLIFFRYRFFL